MIKKIIISDINEIMFIENMLINDKWTNSMFDFEIHNNSLCLKYVLKKNILAYIICHCIIDEIDILKLVVHPMHRNKNIGSLLLNYIKYYILKDNNKIYLEVRYNNNIAINFYKKNNFNKIYIRKNYYKYPNDNAIIMCFIRKDLEK